jgi:hypothetical protein
MHSITLNTVHISTDPTLCHFSNVHIFTYFFKVNFNVILQFISTLPCGFLTWEFPAKILYATFVFPSLSSLTKTFQITFLSLERSSVGVESNNFKIQTKQTGGDREYPVEIKYRISRPIRCNFFPEKCDLNSTCVLCTKGKYYLQTYKYLYIYYTSLSWLWF